MLKSTLHIRNMVRHVVRMRYGGVWLVRGIGNLDLSQLYQMVRPAPDCPRRLYRIATRVFLDYFQVLLDYFVDYF